MDTKGKHKPLFQKDNGNGKMRFTFVVEGVGQFPFDMLRYDQCWPMAQEDVAKMTQHSEHRRIKLRGCCEPTAARWSSFLWSLVPTDRWYKPNLVAQVKEVRLEVGKRYLVTYHPAGARVVRGHKMTKQFTAVFIGEGALELGDLNFSFRPYGGTATISRSEIVQVLETDAPIMLPN